MKTDYRRWMGGLLATRAPAAALLIRVLVGWVFLSEGVQKLYYTTPDATEAEHNLRFNVGLVFDFGEHHHLLMSGGRSIVGEHLFQGYLAYQATL